MRYLKQTLFQILLLQAHPGAAYHHSFYRLFKLGRHTVPHKTTITQSDQTHLLHRLRFHHPHHALGLERLGPLGSSGVGVPEEEEIWDVDVEVGDQVGDEVAPLPQCVGSEAVDEEQVGFGFFTGLGDPTVDDGAVAKIGDGGSKTRFGEDGAIAPVSCCGEAEAGH